MANCWKQERVIRLPKRVSRLLAGRWLSVVSVSYGSEKNHVSAAADEQARSSVVPAALDQAHVITVRALARRAVREISKQFALSRGLHSGVPQFTIRTWHWADRSSGCAWENGYEKSVAC